MITNPNKKSTTHGFTLLEVLVALTVFAILASITSFAMYNAFNTQTRVKAQTEQLNTLQLALLLIGRDTQQIVSRAIRGNEMHLFPPFIGQPAYVEFTRGGLVNPSNLEQRTTLKRMAYLCQNDKLIRRSWSMLDTPARNVYTDKVLLDNLSQCKFAYLAQNRQILPTWFAYALQQNQHAATLPMAIRITLTLKTWGNMSLLFIFPEGLYSE